MHEYGLACDLVRRLAEEGRKRGAERVTHVRLKVGSLSGVSAEALRFGFEVAARDTIVAPDALEIVPVPARARCGACGRAFEDLDGFAPCPACGAIEKEVVDGTGLVAESFTMETPDGAAEEEAARV